MLSARQQPPTDNKICNDAAQPVLKQAAFFIMRPYEVSYCSCGLFNALACEQRNPVPENVYTVGMVFFLCSPKDLFHFFSLCQFIHQFIKVPYLLG